MAYEKQGVYLPEFEHDNCGAGFICSLNGEKTNSIIHDALEILIKLEHRGAVSADGKTGDGAGILIEIPHKFFQKRVISNFLNKENTQWEWYFYQKESTSIPIVLMRLNQKLKIRDLKYWAGETCL